MLILIFSLAVIMCLILPFIIRYRMKIYLFKSGWEWHGGAYRPWKFKDDMSTQGVFDAWRMAKTHRLANKYLPKAEIDEPQRGSWQ